MGMYYWDLYLYIEAHIDVPVHVLVDVLVYVFVYKLTYVIVDKPAPIANGTN